MFICDSENAYKVYEQKNAINKNETLGHYFITEEKFQELKGFEVFPNDIIVSCAGTIGETFVMSQTMRRGIINQALMIVRLYFQDLAPFYLLYFDFILKKEAAKDGKGTAIKNIPPFDVLKNYLIPIPPITEQERIVKAIEKWFSIIDLLEHEKTDLRTAIQQAKSKILDLAIHGKLVPQDPADEPAIELLKRINPDFVPADNSHYGQLPNGWVTSRLNKIAQIITGNTPSKNHKEYYGNEIPFYKPTDLEQGRYMKYASEYLSALGGTMTRIVPENSVAICCIGSIGKCAYVMQTGATNQQINTIITSKAVLPLYLYYLCCSTTFITLLNSESSAITISIVNKSKLGNIPIPIPPYKEQLRIVEQIENQYAILDSITAEL